MYKLNQYFCKISIGKSKLTKIASLTEINQYHDILLSFENNIKILYYIKPNLVLINCFINLTMMLYSKSNSLKDGSCKC